MFNTLPKSKSAKIVSANRGDQGMRKIASPDELASELHGLLAYANTPNPSRAKIAETLTSLATRVGSTADTRVRTAKLMPRQEKILKDYLALMEEGHARRFPKADLWGALAIGFEYEDLPSSVKDALIRVKIGDLESDVNRWLMDNNNPHLRAASDRVARIRLAGSNQ